MSLTKTERRRLMWLWFGMFAGLLLLLSCLWRMQVGEGSRYEISLDRQSVRRVRIPAMRGRVFERGGACLADNQPGYNIVIYPEELRQSGRRGNTVRAVRDLIARTEKLFGVKSIVSDRDIEEHLAFRRALPLAVWRDIGAREMARLAESGGELNALDIIVESKREYPQGAVAGHLLGYVGKRDNSIEVDDFHYYLPDLTGRAGLERYFDGFLSGRAGGQLLRVDVAGYRREEISAREAVPGGDLMLSLSLSAQCAAEQALAGTVGAVVVLDPSNGDVLALASSPEIDPNWFCPTLSTETWSRLLNDERKPLLNRAINGVYPPGSIFKPIVALAALDTGAISPGYKLDCRGVLQLGNQSFSCYHGHAHGLLDLRQALEVSCNVFFYQIGLKCGVDAISAMSRVLGLGQPSGITAESEAAGLVPGREWKRRVRGEPWREGDTCNMAIGQGALLVTPLQMAVATAAIANGGFVYRPRLVLRRRRAPTAEFQEVMPVLIRRINWADEHLALVRAGMEGVVQGDSGTGRRARIPGVTVAAKTGTAEYGSRRARRKHGWMIAYAPADKPLYVVAMVLDEIETAGGAEVAPRVRSLLCSLFQIPEEWI